MEERFSRPEFNVMRMVEDRIQYLETIKGNIENEYKRMPEGSILVGPGSTENSFRYYLRSTPQDKMGEYLDASKDRVKKQYSTKKYYETLLKQIDEEIKGLNKIKRSKLQDSIITSYEKMSPGIKKQISPINIDDETYISLWTSESYIGLGFDENDTTSYYTDRGERVRSKSEMLIANTLIRMGIPYKYECPVITNDGKKLYPDFTILDVKKREIKYWEHLGKMSDMSYLSRNIWKLYEYKKINILLGVNLFLTYENEINPLGATDIRRTIDAIIQ